jgi:acyl-coenzyme A synthetase/AMP-(fatty) acid ligase
MTGDLAEYNAYGELVYVGRKDSQIKHKGARLELGEVENAANALDGVAYACCGYDRTRGKIVLFYAGDLGEPEVLRGLAARLAHYAVPEIIIRKDALPTLPNGKIDRVTLMEGYHDPGR